jgi:UDP-N-acetylglucosamine 4,6-dehydratase
VTVALVTGCSGTFGQALLQAAPGWTIRAYSRDEYKQAQLSEQYPGVRWLLGDVRDLPRLRRAVEGCDLVIHAAALKHVTAGEYNPDEFVKTNVLGTLNVAEACLDAGVDKAIFLSSDKAVHPVNLYGATKLCGEKLWLSAASLHGATTLFSVVRYGNVKGSRGSVLTKEAPVLRDARATRFWMEPEHAVLLVLLAVEQMQGGEVFVPKAESGLVTDQQNSWVEGPEGLLPGEKLHESLVSDEEVGRTYDFGSHYCILPRDHPLALISVPVPDGFTYTSG